MINLTATESTWKGEPLPTSGYIAWVRYEPEPKLEIFKPRPLAIMLTTPDDPGVELGQIAFAQHAGILVTNDVYASAILLSHALAKRMIAVGSKAHIRTRKGPDTH